MCPQTQVFLGSKFSFLSTYTLSMSEGKNGKHPLLPQTRVMSSHGWPSGEIFSGHGEIVLVGGEEGKRLAVTVLTAAFSYS